MNARIFTLLTICLPVVCLTVGCTRENLPEGLEFSVVKEPSPLPLMNGQVALVYEVAVKNSSVEAYTFVSAEVTDGTDVLLSLSGIGLDEVVTVHNSTSKLLNPGETALLYSWVELSSDDAIPETLNQRIGLTRASDSERFTEEMEITVSGTAPVVLTAPLKARRYVASGAPSGYSYHRLAAVNLDGKYWLSGRYAVDFIGLDDGERFRIGRQNTNGDYFGYEDVVYSTTAGDVITRIDSMAENVPPVAPVIAPSTPYRAGGNQVVVKVSEGVYVFYGHLVKGSVLVKAGDRIEVGQPIGRLGNSGNSDGPQLHLQVMDGPDPLRSQGIPWVFSRFTHHGAVTGYDRVNGMVDVSYLNIQQPVSSKNIGGDAVVDFE
jgi:murein DD-endopeptidase MepM/ murein hydrolase activator NlpD